MNWDIFLRVLFLFVLLFLVMGFASVCANWMMGRINAVWALVCLFVIAITTAALVGYFA